MQDVSRVRAQRLCVGRGASPVAAASARIRSLLARFGSDRVRHAMAVDPHMRSDRSVHADSLPEALLPAARGVVQSLLEPDENVLGMIEVDLDANLMRFAGGGWC